MDTERCRVVLFTPGHANTFVTVLSKTRGYLSSLRHKKVVADMDDFSVYPHKHRQRSQRVDDHFMIDGSDEEAAPEDRGPGLQRNNTHRAHP
ncbi:hypothetical protein V1506DRAFT_545385 [Lipomyces tetrasporus]